MQVTHLGVMVNSGRLVRYSGTMCVIDVNNIGLTRERQLRSIQAFPISTNF